MKFDRTKLIEALSRVVQRMHYPLEVMLVCVRWYAAYPLSFRGVGARRRGGRGWPVAATAYAGASERRTELGLAASSMRLRTAAPTTASVRRAASPRARSRSPMSDL